MFPIRRSWSRDKRGSQIVLFVVTGEQVVTQAQIQGQALGDFPVILEIRTHFQVSPVPHVGLQCRLWGLVEAGAGCGTDPGIHACVFFRRSIRCEEQADRTFHTKDAPR